MPAVPNDPASVLFAQILETPLPEFREKIRSLRRKEWAKKVRGLFKDLGIKGVSVTAPVYSQASSIDINLPDTPAHDYREDWQGGSHDRPTCPICRERYAATKKIEQLILAAYPDLDNRSDTQSDYFNSCLSIH